MKIPKCIDCVASTICELKIPIDNGCKRCVDFHNAFLKIKLNLPCVGCKSSIEKCIKCVIERLKGE